SRDPRRPPLQGRAQPAPARMAAGGSTRRRCGDGPASPGVRVSWDDPETARAYDAFCSTHGRYRVANGALVRGARIGRRDRVLDVGAGTGGPAAAALRGLGPRGEVVCVEPSKAMRSIGRRRVSDPRVVWRRRLPPRPGGFDRVLCGASVWLLGP